MRITGSACGLGIEGSGWIAGPGVVVTNAHVVAGQDDTEVTAPGGETLDASALHYEPRNDLAVLRVSGLAGTALELAAKPRKGTVSAADRLSRERSADALGCAPRQDGDRREPGLLWPRPD